MTEREKLVELLAQRCEIQSKGCVGCKSNWPGAADCKQERFARVADHLLANGVTVREMIPITEEVPDGNCLAVNNRGAYTVGKIVKDPYLSAVTGYSCMRDGIGIANVTHWMSLPKAKKEETSNE